MTELDSILKRWDITLPTKVHLVKAMVFPVAMYRCRSWTIKKPECWRNDAFELWCQRRHPWTARVQDSQRVWHNWATELNLLFSWETCMQVKKHQLELDMELWTGSKLGKEYVKAVYCHPAYIASIQSTSWVPWTARKSNQSILKEISPEYSLQGLMLKLKLQYFGHLIWRTDSFKRLWCWERLKVGGEGDNRGWNGWMASLTWWTWVWVSSGIW